MTSIVFTVEGPPQGKRRHRLTTVNGYPRMHPHPKDKLYEKLIGFAAKVAMMRRALKPFDCAVELCICAVMPVPKSWSIKKRNRALVEDIRPTGKPDFDNIEKVVADAVKGIVWHDDSQVCVSNFRKKYGKEPYLQVEVHTLEPTDMPGMF